MLSYQMQIEKVHLPTLSQVKIVDFLFKNIGKRPTQAEIAKGTGQKKSYKNVRESLNELAKQGIVKIDKVGNYKTCSLDLLNHAALNYLVLIEHAKKESVFKKAKDVEYICKKILDEIMEHTQNFSMLLFGSHAKKEFHEKSDVDLIVIADKNAHEKIKRTISSISAITTKRVDSFVVTEKEYAEMITGISEINVGTESLKNHVVMHGVEYFLAIVGRVYGKN